MSTKKDTKSTKSTASGTTNRGLSDVEREAMKERLKELRAEEGKSKKAKKADGESEVLAKIASMPASDRAIAKRIHAIIKETAPALTSKLWYGMPSYSKDGKILCFYQAADKFKTRYGTLGFNDVANLDEGNMWATAFGLKKLTAADEAKIRALVKKAVS